MRPTWNRPTLTYRLHSNSTWHEERSRGCVTRGLRVHRVHWGSTDIAVEKGDHLQPVGRCVPLILIALVAFVLPGWAACLHCEAWAGSEPGTQTHPPLPGWCFLLHKRAEKQGGKCEETKHKTTFSTTVFNSIFLHSIYGTKYLVWQV